MSPGNGWSTLAPRLRALVNRTAMDLGAEIRAERMRRRWTLRDLAEKAGVSPSMIHGVEAGEPASLEGYWRIAAALGLQLRFTLLPDRAAVAGRAVEPVHSAMGEIEAEQFGGYPFEVRLDEPYQHSSSPAART